MVSGMHRPLVYPRMSSSRRYRCLLRRADPASHRPPRRHRPAPDVRSGRQSCTGLNAGQCAPNHLTAGRDGERCARLTGRAVSQTPTAKTSGTDLDSRATVSENQPDLERETQAGTNAAHSAIQKSRDPGALLQHVIGDLRNICRAPRHANRHRLNLRCHMNLSRR